MTTQTLIVKAIGYAVVALVWALVIGLPLVWWLGTDLTAPGPYLTGALYGLIATGIRDVSVWWRERQTINPPHPDG